VDSNIGNRERSPFYQPPPRPTNYFAAAKCRDGKTKFRRNEASFQEDGIKTFYWGGKPKPLFSVINKFSKDFKRINRPENYPVSSSLVYLYKKIVNKHNCPIKRNVGCVVSLLVCTVLSVFFAINLSNHQNLMQNSGLCNFWIFISKTARQKPPQLLSTYVQ
jgi:hypothetical protein